MSLFRDLINAGFGQVDAQELDAIYAAEPEFLEGMEQIARLLFLKEAPGTSPPLGEPWKTIYVDMSSELQAGSNHDLAWQVAVNNHPANIRLPLTNVVQKVMKDVADLESQKRKSKIKTVHFLKEFKRLGYDFRLNLCDDSIEVNGERITDAVAAVIIRQMDDKGFSSRADVELCWMAAAYKGRYHPVRNYLSSLTYDGGQYISELASYFQDQQNIFPLWIRKFLIGAVAKAFTGAQNPMLVLDGDQNLGKSTFARWLCPLQKYFIESAIDPDNKDHAITLMNKWIWEVTELGGTMRKADQEALKGFLTLEEITVRAPYGHYPMQKPAMASFIGTVNNVGGVLNDPTGSRRFHISKLLKIDWDYIKLDRNKIWAEAVAAYLAGEKWTLDENERKLRDEINAEYQVEDPIENLVRQLFKLDPANNSWWTSTTEMIKTLEDPYQGAYRGSGTKATTMHLGETMKRLGHRKGRKNNIMGYFGVAPTP